MTFEPGIGAKWLELLKELVRGLTRAAIIRDPAITAGIGQWSAIQALAPSLRVEVTPVNVRDPREIERAVGAALAAPNGRALPRRRRRIGWAMNIE
jgi:putative ABC transport system substrate-binding protein